MTITATCGHQIPDNSNTYYVTRKGYTERGYRALWHEMVCLHCQRLMADDILHTEEERQAWVNYEDVGFGKEE